MVGETRVTCTTGTFLPIRNKLVMSRSLYFRYTNVSLWYWPSPAPCFITACCIFLPSGEDCVLEISTPRKRVHIVSVGGNLTINCQVDFCNDRKPNVSWYKVENGTDPVNISSRVQAGWERSDDSEGIFSLMFRDMQSSDSGQYRCQGVGAVGHNIKVTVRGECATTWNLQTWVHSPLTLIPRCPSFTSPMVELVFFCRWSARHWNK